VAKRALLVCAALLAAAPSRAFWWGPHADSRWRDRTITVDGRDDDWQDREPDEAEGLAFAFANDDKDLYVLVSPHTRALKQQLAGDFQQDFTIWIDTCAGKKERIAVKLLAPAGSADPADRDVETVGIDTNSVAAKDTADLRMGPMHERGVLEARIPLSYLGSPLPKMIGVGLQTSAFKKTPPAGGRRTTHTLPKDEESGQDSLGGGRGHGQKGGAGGKHGGADAEEFEPIDLWIRVSLSARSGRP
jgi:hypothetical protein